jgi:hypothetical protein
VLAPLIFFSARQFGAIWCFSYLVLVAKRSFLVCHSQMLKLGIQKSLLLKQIQSPWIPAFAGMTSKKQKTAFPQQELY